MSEDKKYLFRDLDANINLYTDNKQFHACGYVDKIYSDKSNPLPSGKDLSVNFFDPIECDITSQWRSWDEVELIEVEEYEYKDIARIYHKIECLINNDYGWH